MWQGQGQQPQQEQMTSVATAPPGTFVAEAGVVSGRLFAVLGRLAARASSGNRVAEDIFGSLVDCLGSLVEPATR